LGLVVVNAIYPTLPANAANVLRNAVSKHTVSLQSVLHGGTLLLEKDLRLERDGVFIANTKIADLNEILQQVDRPHVTEIRRLTSVGHPVAKGAAIGTAVGLGIGLIVGSAKECSGGCEDPGLTTRLGIGYGIGLGLVGGMIGGAVYGAARNEGTTVIYHAP
jgi:hypothetical protein